MSPLLSSSDSSSTSISRSALLDDLVSYGVDVGVSLSQRWIDEPVKVHSWVSHYHYAHIFLACSRHSRHVFSHERHRRASASVPGSVAHATSLEASSFRGRVWEPDLTSYAPGLPSASGSHSTLTTVIVPTIGVVWRAAEYGSLEAGEAHSCNLSIVRGVVRISPLNRYHR